MNAGRMVYKSSGDRIVESIESLTRLNAIEREFLKLAGRAATLLEFGDEKGARALMVRMESLHNEVKGMNREGAAI
jgi:hypothetical protein